MIALHNSREPFSGEVALQGNYREHPALADLAARQHAGFGFQAHRFWMGAEQGRGGDQVDRLHRRCSCIPLRGSTRSATRGLRVFDGIGHKYLI
ncbi:hypothetical protein WK43_24855 [Burkholderia ubonensis]|nr:hypothetical protein WK37_20495 [Burkholderia ubonensis]KVS53100.1 hypothetical protein WK38_09410 [Burkholderia ubonensis]KVS71294.1 hypothetical protein WK42_24860 [Burkholderia ubonensis]KVS83368.1 hypothetical protein WK43_24855 [Burkholderia ubonensis]KVS88500.1 hypothetical protein WK45_27420 [Burkholderia ubonensis]